MKQNALPIQDFACCSGCHHGSDFVDIRDVNQSIHVEMRYAADWNFIGRTILGYQSNKCFLTKEAAEALAKVPEYVQSHGYSLLVFDCYRPQRAVQEFVSWVKGSKRSKNENDVLSR